MSTTEVNLPARAPHLPGRRYDRQFFLGMVILLLAVVAIGFGPTYYLAGGPRAQLPSRIVHIHGAVFTLWMLLLLVQTAFISAKKVALHRTLGTAGFLLAPLMVVMAMLTAVGVLTRIKSSPHTDEGITFLIIPFIDAFDFAVLAGAAYALRRNSPAHKRLVIIATIAISAAALFRWRVPLLYHDGYAAYYASYLFLVFMAVYDLWSTHKIHRATLWGGAFVIFMEQISRFIGPTPAWHSIARWVQSWSV